MPHWHPPPSAKVPPLRTYSSSDRHRRRFRIFRLQCCFCGLFSGSVFSRSESQQIANSFSGKCPEISTGHFFQKNRNGDFDLPDRFGQRYENPRMFQVVTLICAVANLAESSLRKPPVLPRRKTAQRNAV